MQVTPAEEVTMEWLVAKGFFVMPTVKHGRKEVDLLAVSLAGDRASVSERVHIEVHVSSNPLSTRYSQQDYRDAAKSFLDKKFEAVKEKVQEILGESYSRWLVLGKLGGGETEEAIQAAQMRELGVRVIRFDEVVREYLPTITTRPTGGVGQLFHILKAYGMLGTVRER